MKIVADVQIFMITFVSLKNDFEDMKHLFYLIAIMLVACAPRPADQQQEAHAATITQMRFHCDRDTTVINDLLAKGHQT